MGRKVDFIDDLSRRYHEEPAALRAEILKVLRECSGEVTRAARRYDVSRQCLWNYLYAFELEKVPRQIREHLRQRFRLPGAVVEPIKPYGGYREAAYGAWVERMAGDEPG